MYNAFIQQSPTIQACTMHSFSSRQPFRHVQCIHPAVTNHSGMYNASIQQSPNTQPVSTTHSINRYNKSSQQPVEVTTHPDKCNSPVIIPPCGFLQTRQCFLGIFSSDTKCSTWLTSCEKLQLTAGD